MAIDTKYLHLRDGRWHFDYKVPAKFKQLINTDRLRGSLNTTDLKQARHLRDKYLVPVLTAKTIKELLENFMNAINKSQLEVGDFSSELKAFLKRGDVEHRITLKDLCVRFSKNYSTGRFAEGSRTKLASSIHSICHVLGANTVADLIDRKMVTAFRDTLLAMAVNWQSRKSAEAAGTRKLSPKSVKIHLSYLKRVLSWGMSEGLLKSTANPVDGVTVIMAGPTPHKRPPTPEEAGLLCSMPVPKSGTLTQLTWSSLPLFGRYTGCRVGELSQLTAGNIIVKNGVRCLQITAFGEGRQLKTESSERLVPVADKLAPVLDKVLQERPAGVLFPDCGHCYAKDGKTIHKAAHGYIKVYSRSAKKISPDQSFHCWRAYANNQMADAGVDILDREAILGHKSDRVQKSYTADNLHRWKAAVDKIT
jgi:integrase